MKIYFDFADWWIGYYRGPNHHYVCPVPTVVIRWKRKDYTWDLDVLAGRFVRVPKTRTLREVSDGE